MAHLIPSLQTFLATGATLRAVVGLDIENTSQEGLEDLLSLRTSGSAEVYVYHNEANSTFHPKVYLFHDGTTAKLIVGSNNLTEAGLFINTEAGLVFEGPLSNSTVRDASAALAAWRDPSLRLALPLDSNLIQDLVNQGYILPETALNSRRASSASSGSRTSGGRRALFGRVSISAPRRPVQISTSTTTTRPLASAALSAQPVGMALLMRVRKAHPIDRPTQTQVPKVIRNTFFQGVTTITSAHDNRTHRIFSASARGSVNTNKVEIPEIRDYANPVIRFENTNSGIFYQAFDAQSVLGRPIFAALSRGLNMSPPQTRVTKPSNRQSSTWWRFI